MIVVHVLRKPVPKGSTVAKNVLEHGTGSINIDASRIRTGDNLNGGGYSPGGNPTGLPGDNRTGAAAGMFAEGGGRLSGQFKQPSGRWPSNFILEHKAGCVCVGEKKVKSDGHFPATRPAGSKISGQSGHAGQSGLPETQLKSETVAKWECEAGCPVATLEAQAESSRFFKQVQEASATGTLETAE